MKELAVQMLNETIMLYSVNEAGKLLSVSQSTIRKYISKRKIASVKIGRRVLIPYETLAKLVRDGYRPERPKRTQQKKDQPIPLQRSFFA